MSLRQNHCETHLRVAGKHEIVRIFQATLQMNRGIGHISQRDFQCHRHFDVHFFIQKAVEIQWRFDNFDAIDHELGFILICFAGTAPSNTVHASNLWIWFHCRQLIVNIQNVCT